MSDYDRTNSGVLFKNDRKESDNHPDYKGSINVGGVDYWLAAWIRDGNKGKFMKISVKPKEAETPARRPPPARTPPQRPSRQEDPGDAPF